MIASGMKTTLVRFQNEYCSYKGIVEEGSKMDNKDNNGLAIGAFESAFCADVGAIYIYEMCENIIKKLLYVGTYHDDGLAIFEGQQSVNQTILWFCNFELQVDGVAEGISSNSLQKYGSH
eukprot:330371-Ditylum_brightwellii.AAC.1